MFSSVLPQNYLLHLEKITMYVNFPTIRRLVFAVVVSFIRELFRLIMGGT